MVLSRFNCDPKVLIDAVHRFPQKLILVIGDLMLDRFVWGAVSRISPEAPVPVVEIRKETTCLGGAANVVANIRSLCGRALPIGVIGADGEGSKLIQELRAIGTSVSGLIKDKERPTSVKTRIIAHHQQICRTDLESKSPLSALAQKRVIQRFRSGLAHADAVIVSDYAKGLLSPAVLGEILPMAKAAGKVVCVDPKTKNLAAYMPATVITPNAQEAEQASGITISGDKELMMAGNRIIRQSKVPYLLMTRGEEGMALFSGPSRVSHIPTVAREVFDVTGAGDTVISVLALGYASGLTMLEAAILANIAAGIVVGKLGTASATPTELIARINSQS